MTTMGADLEHLLGRTLAGFRLSHLLGSGTSAVVFRGENLLHRELVRSLKILRPEAATNPASRARFVEEATVLARIEHPNVVRCHGLREDRLDGEDLLVMELDYLEGHSLGTVMLRSVAPPSTTEIVGWIHDASLGLAAAHALGIVHRDVRPDNLFLTRDGVVKVLDFGFARDVDETTSNGRLGRAGEAPGAIAYFAPEICEGGTPTPASDVYAMGLTLAELLLGHHPFDPPGQKPRTGPQMAFAQRHDAVPRLRSARADVPDALEAIVRRATEKRARDRFPDASALARALEGLQPSEPRAEAARAAVRTEFVMPKMRSTYPPAEPARPAVVTSNARRFAVAVAVVMACSAIALCARRTGALRDSRNAPAQNRTNPDATHHAR